MDYTLLRAGVVPHVPFDIHNSLCITNPLGVKGPGEAGAIGVTPAVVNAIVDAIYLNTGIRHVGIPATAKSQWAAIKATREKKVA
jgi:carbon-monoxide dehydrogenase large subunit